MADVRAMLRQERAARQQTSLKSQRPTPAAKPAQVVGSKKRKANDDEDSIPEVRKRSKAEEARGLPAGFFDDGGPIEESEVQPMEAEAPVTEAPVAAAVMAPTATDAALDEELEAFKREMDALPLPQTNATLSALNGSASISAAPLSATELAAQAREEQSAQKGQREAEIEGEKEDAARHLEEEFEEMEELEERVKRLRDKREALRKASMSQVDVEERTLVAEVHPEEAIEEESEDGSDVEDWDDWTFRRG